MVTKRILSQLYGHGEGGCAALSDAELHRKLSLCRELLHYIAFVDGGYSQFRDGNLTSTIIRTSAANRLIGEVVQSRRRPLLGPSPG